MPKIIPSESRLDEHGVPVCVYCAKVLRKAPRSLWWRYGPAVQAYGWQGNNIFCSQKCAASWGIRKASTGFDG